LAYTPTLKLHTQYMYGLHARPMHECRMPRRGGRGGRRQRTAECHACTYSRVTLTYSRVTSPSLDLASAVENKVRAAFQNGPRAPVTTAPGSARIQSPRARTSGKAAQSFQPPHVYSCLCAHAHAHARALLPVKRGARGGAQGLWGPAGRCRTRPRGSANISGRRQQAQAATWRVLGNGNLPVLRVVDTRAPPVGGVVAVPCRACRPRPHRDQPDPAPPSAAAPATHPAQR